MNPPPSTKLTHSIDRVLDELDRLANSEPSDESFFHRLIGDLSILLGNRYSGYFFRVHEAYCFPLVSVGELPKPEANALDKIRNFDPEAVAPFFESCSQAFQVDGLLVQPVSIAGLLSGCLVVQNEAESEPFAKKVLEAFAEIVSARLTHQKIKRLVEVDQVSGKAIGQISHTSQTVDCDRLLVDACLSLISADRISLVSKADRRAQVLAIGGLAEFHNKSDEVRRLEELVVRHDESPSQKSTDLSLESENQSLPHAACFKVSQTGDSSVFLVLQCTQKPSLSHALYELSLIPTSLIEAWRQQRRFLAIPALFRRSWDFVGLSSNYLTRFVWIAACLLILGVLLLWPTTMTIHCTGVLEPELSTRVFATGDGIIDELLVEEGDQIEPQTTLLTIRSPELELEIDDTLGRLQVVEEQISGFKIAMSQNEANATGTTSQAQLAGDLSIAELTRHNLTKRLAFLREEKTRHTLKSDCHGTIIAEQLQRNLRGRPVKRGDHLFDVIHENSSWSVRADVAERDSGYVMDAIHDKIIRIQWKLESDLTRSYSGSVRSVGFAIDNSEGRSSLPVFLSVELNDFGEAKPGTTAVVSLECGRKPMWFIWFRPLIEQWQMRNWLRIW